MATISAPRVQTQQVVTGTMYQISIAESADGTGITKLEIGPYRFDGAPPQVKYPEAPTNELCPPGFHPVHWETDDKGASYLLFDGGRIASPDGEVVFQFTSNYPPATYGGATLTVWRDNLPESFRVPLPDYTQQPPKFNSRHDSTGLGRIYKGTGCIGHILLVAAGLCVVAHLATLGALRVKRCQLPNCAASINSLLTTLPGASEP